MPEIVISDAGIRKLLANIRPHKVSGPDSIPARLLKETAANLAPALTMVYQASLSQGPLPGDWKSAHITPILKKGDRSGVANYRPVSLTCMCCRLIMMEHMVASNIMKHMEYHSRTSIQMHSMASEKSGHVSLRL